MGKAGESIKASAYFEEYVTLGPERSLEKLAELLYQRQATSKPAFATWLSKLKKMSATYGWVERVKQKDREAAAESRRKKQEVVDRMNEEHALLGRTHALRAAKQIQELIEAKRFGSQSAVTLLKVSTDLERVARGAATENKQVTIDEMPSSNKLSFDLSKLTDEQLARLEQIAEEVEESE